MKKTKRSTSSSVTKVSETHPTQKDTPTNHIVNLQNNYNFAQTIDLGKLSTLTIHDQDLANRVMRLYEQQFLHAKEMDSSIIRIEDEEQKIRKTEMPYQRIFAFVGLAAAWSLSVLSLGGAAYAVYMNQPYVAGVFITIPVGVLAVNMLGVKNKAQK